MPGGSANAHGPFNSFLDATSSPLTVLQTFYIDSPLLISLLRRYHALYRSECLADAATTAPTFCDGVQTDDELAMAEEHLASLSVPEGWLDLYEEAREHAKLIGNCADVPYRNVSDDEWWASRAEYALTWKLAHSVAAGGHLTLRQQVAAYHKRRRPPRCRLSSVSGTGRRPQSPSRPPPWPRSPFDFGDADELDNEKLVFGTTFTPHPSTIFTPSYRSSRDVLACLHEATLVHEAALARMAPHSSLGQYTRLGRGLTPFGLFDEWGTPCERRVGPATTRGAGLRSPPFIPGCLF